MFPAFRLDLILMKGVLRKKRKQHIYHFPTDSIRPLDGQNLLQSRDSGQPFSLNLSSEWVTLREVADTYCKHEIPRRRHGHDANPRDDRQASYRFERTAA